MFFYFTKNSRTKKKLASLPFSTKLSRSSLCLISKLNSSSYSRSVALRQQSSDLHSGSKFKLNNSISFIQANRSTSWAAASLNSTSVQSRTMSSQGDSNNTTTNFSRLPKNVVPNHYSITIRPEISNFTFTGTETVNVDVREQTTTIVLNSLDIEIQSASFVSNNQGKRVLLLPVNLVNLLLLQYKQKSIVIHYELFIHSFVLKEMEWNRKTNFLSIPFQIEHQSVKIESNNDDEIAVITFANALHVGPGQLKLQFSGVINDLMKGCYRSKYTTPDGEVRYAITTQFESVYCSKCASC